MSSCDSLFLRATRSPVVLQPGCKVNLHLAIKGVHADGYHELDSLFVPLSVPHDTLTITQSETSRLQVTCSLTELQGPNNILHTAWMKWSERVGYVPCLTIHLHKNIPVGGGLGGGSSDAAALLRWLNQTAGAYGLSDHELAELARDIGSDVPFFLCNRPCRARGRGELLEEADLDLACYQVLLICPKIHVASAWAYRQWDELVGLHGVEKKCSRILTTSGLADRQSSSRRHLVLYNDFERVVFPAHPLLYRLKMTMLDRGACGCVMSGSGASLVAFFEGEQDRERVCAYLEAKSIPFFT